MRKFFQEAQYESLAFVTTTILDWKKLFLNHDLAKIVLESLNFYIQNGSWEVYVYALMPNHLHLILKVLEPNKLSSVLGNFHKFTARTIVKYLKENDRQLLKDFLVNKIDREYQIWQREPVVKNIISEDFLRQKVNYIHENSTQERWRGILKINDPWDYEFSSARFYYTGINDKYLNLTRLVL